MSLIILLVLFFLILKFFRLINILLSLEFLFLSFFYLLMELDKISDYLIMIMFGVFSSLFSMSIFLKYVINFGSDFVKF
nr:NADH dehydrogenase subunit 4L [Meloidogyne exigua]